MCYSVAPGHFATGLRETDRRIGAMIEPGDQAPDFTLPNQDGDSVSLSDLRGRRVVLYFYPKADTPGC